jgi:putative addiction module antidote
MKRKIVKTGSSLAVTLPREVVKDFNLRAGDDVDVSVHPHTGAIIVRSEVRYVEGGQVTPRLKSAARRVMDKYDKAFEKLAK